MIQIHTETLIPLRDAPKLVPRRLGGQLLHVSAVYRWASKGVAGVRLEVVRIGGTKYTSKEALQRFADRLSQDHAGPGAQPPEPNRSPGIRTLPTELAAELNLPPARGPVAKRNRAAWGPGRLTRLAGQ